MNLVAKGTRKHYKNYNQKTDSPDLPNLLNQTFITISINKVWVGDISYIPTKEGTLYLSVFIDLYSRKGNPYDNTVMESFYRTLKRELINDSHYDTRQQAQQDIFKYIEIYYNAQRMHSSLNYLTPMQFEAQHISIK